MALFTAILLIPLALANGYLFPSLEGYSNTSAEGGSFEEWLATADASAEESVRFRSIYGEYPGGKEGTIYTDWLRVDAATDEDPPQAVAGIHPGLNTELYHENGTIDTNPSWAVCLSLTRFRDTGILRDEPIAANCSNVFPTDCIDWLESTNPRQNMCINDARNRSSPWKGSPCDGVLEGQNSDGVLEPSFVGNPIHMLNLTVSLPFEDDETTNAYDDVYMLTASFAQWDPDEEKVMADSERIKNSFTCLRADESDAGVSLSAPSKWAMAFGAFAVIMTTVV